MTLLRSNHPMCCMSQIDGGAEQNFCYHSRRSLAHTLPPAAPPASVREHIRWVPADYSWHSATGNKATNDPNPNRCDWHLGFQGCGHEQRWGGGPCRVGEGTTGVPGAL